MSGTKYTAPRGTLDFLPPESVKMLLAEEIFRGVCDLYGYQPVRTPTFETTELFARGAGESSDIVSKEMYTFPDKKGRSLTLRPEGTPGVVRAMIQAGWNFSEQSRVHYVGPMFRYQRPQKGRYREHTQVGVEILGADSVTADAEVISLGVLFLERLYLDNLRIVVNSIGSAEDRISHNAMLKEYIKSRWDDFCPDCHYRSEHNPLRVFDCKSPDCRVILSDAPRINEALSDESKIRFEQLLMLLEAEGLVVKVDPMLVRGLDYYTHTVFEIMMEGDTGQQSSLMGGGRYDGLVEMYGGPPTPAMGFGAGLERIIEAVDWSDFDDNLMPACDVAVITIGDMAPLFGSLLANDLRVLGVITHNDHRGTSLKNQLGQANTLRATYAVIIGEDELKEQVALVKEMSSGEQITMPIDKVADYLRDALFLSED